MMLDNLLAWSLQVLALAGAGTLLPALFRLHDPRWQPRYYQALLALCLLLPALQPWRSEIVPAPATGAADRGGRVMPVRPAPGAPPFSAERIAVAVFAAGLAARSLWLAQGLLRLRKHRRDARSLYPLPDAVQAALQRTGADAVVCLSGGHTGPVTFGLGVPVVLLPESFLALPQPAQFAVACHELLHVRRRDWPQHMLEEIVSIALWFHPAVWWLVSRIRLAREQAVDHQVVQLTQARDPYVDALLALSGARPPLDLAPAPLFLRRRHLVARIASLVKEVSMSRRRLVSSYISMGAALAGAAWMCSALFPLRALPQVRADPGPQRVREAMPRGAAADDAGVTVDTGGPILHRVGLAYPVEARRGRTGGAVVLELTLDAQGSVTDARALSGPEQLRRSALESALQWHYAPAAGSRVQATFEFRPPAIFPPPPPPPPPASGALEKIDLSQLPEPLRTALAPRLARFEGGPYSPEVMREIREIVAAVDPHLSFIRLSQSGQAASYVLTLFPPGQEPRAAGDAFPPAPDGVMRIGVGGNVQAEKIENKVQPEYPALARQARLQGTVRFNVLLNTDGAIKNLQVVSGHPLLVQSAYDAVKQWTWKPTLLNGNAVEVVTVVDVNYTLSQ
jgi:protein TonB